MLADCAEDVEMHLIGGFADLMGAEFTGREGVRRWFEEWVGSLDVYIEIESIFDAKQQVVAMTRTTGVGDASGTPVELRGGVVYSFRGSQISELALYYEPREALKAVGLAE
jgi:ketosteroid isomerase-like protein